MIQSKIRRPSKRLLGPPWSAALPHPPVTSSSCTSALARSSCHCGLLSFPKCEWRLLSACFGPGSTVLQVWAWPTLSCLEDPLTFSPTRLTYPFCLPLHLFFCSSDYLLYILHIIYIIMIFIFCLEKGSNFDNLLSADVARHLKISLE